MKVFYKKYDCDITEILDPEFNVLARFDTNQLPLVSSFNWSKTHGHLITRRNKKLVYLHEVITGFKTTQDIVVDHIDGDPANNCINNLQIVSKAFNTLKMNRPCHLPLGVTQNNKSYKAQIRVGKRRIFFSSQDLDYLKNIIFTLYVETGLATPEQFSEAHLASYKPTRTMKTEKHQKKFDYALAALTNHVSNFRQPVPLG